MSAQGGFAYQGKRPTDIPDLVAWWNGRNADSFRGVSGNKVQADNTTVKFWDSLVNNWALFQSIESRLHKYKLTFNRGSYDVNTNNSIFGGLSMSGSLAGSPNSETIRWDNDVNSVTSKTVVLVTSVENDMTSIPLFVLGGDSAGRLYYVGKSWSGANMQWRINPLYTNTSTNLSFEPRIFANMAYTGRPIVVIFTVDQSSVKLYENNVLIGTVNIAVPIEPRAESNSYSARISHGTGNTITNSQYYSACVYNRALTAQELTDLYTYLRTAYNVNP